ncbi:DUF4286 family protein [Solilutibacter pythonis]|nr:DUF4286 family protein [Lysobacter pythonis]
MSAPVVYEVNFRIEAAIAGEFRAWPPTHVGEMLALPGLSTADVGEMVEPASAPGEVALSVRYRLRDADALRDYFDRHAARMREAGTARFGGRLRATRRVLRVLPG